MLVVEHKMEFAFFAPMSVEDAFEALFSGRESIVILRMSLRCHLKARGDEAVKKMLQDMFLARLRAVMGRELALLQRCLAASAALTQHLAAVSDNTFELELALPADVVRAIASALELKKSNHATLDYALAMMRMDSAKQLLSAVMEKHARTHHYQRCIADILEAYAALPHHAAVFADAFVTSTLSSVMHHLITTLEVIPKAVAEMCGASRSVACEHIGPRTCLAPTMVGQSKARVANSYVMNVLRLHPGPLPKSFWSEVRQVIVDTKAGGFSQLVDAGMHPLLAQVIAPTGPFPVDAATVERLRVLTLRHVARCDRDLAVVELRLLSRLLSDLCEHALFDLAMCLCMCLHVDDMNASTRVCTVSGRMSPAPSSPSSLTSPRIVSSVLQEVNPRRGHSLTIDEDASIVWLTDDVCVSLQDYAVLDAIYRGAQEEVEALADLQERLDDLVRRGLLQPNADREFDIHPHLLEKLTHT